MIMSLEVISAEFYKKYIKAEFVSDSEVKITRSLEVTGVIGVSETRKWLILKKMLRAKG